MCCDAPSGCSEPREPQDHGLAELAELPETLAGELESADEEDFKTPRLPGEVVDTERFSIRSSVRSSVRSPTSAWAICCGPLGSFQPWLALDPRSSACKEVPLAVSRRFQGQGQR